MSNYNVGVNLVEGQSLSPIGGVTTGICGLMGNFVKGPLHEATLVTNLSQAQGIFGIKPPTGCTSAYSVKAFFAKVGSGRLYIVRVASSAAAKAFKTFQDRQGGPADTLKVYAKNEGIWGNALQADIDDYSILSTEPEVTIPVEAESGRLVSIEGLEVGSDLELDNGTNQEYVRITQIDAANKTVYWTGGLTYSYPTETSTVKSMEFSLKIYDTSLLVETWDGLSMNDAVTFHCERVIAGNSNYITVEDLKTVDTDYTDLPAVTTPQALTGGADGLSDVTKDDYVGVEASKTGKYAFDAVEGLFRFDCPNPLLTNGDLEVAYKALVQDLLDYANTRVLTHFIGDVPYGKIPTEAVTFRNNFAGRRLTCWYPWMKVLEEKVEVFLPLSSFVLGCSVEKDYRRGVHKNIGNEAIPYAIDVEYPVSVPEGEVLNDAGVNVARKFRGRGIRTYGGRTCSALTLWRFNHYAELWSYIGRSLMEGLADVPFEPHDQFLWKSVIRRVEAFLANEQSKGALFDASNPTGKAYLVKMDSFNNPNDQIALGIAMVEVEYVPVGTAEKFVIKLTSSPTGLSVA